MMRSVILSAALLLFACAKDVAVAGNRGFIGVAGSTAGSTAVNPVLPGTGGTGVISPGTQGGAGKAGMGMTSVGGAGKGGAGGAMAMSAGKGGTGAAGKSTAGTGAGGTTTVMTSKDPKIPAVAGDCPKFAEGTSNGDFMGLTGVIWEVGPKMQGTGSLIFYWHGTGSTSGEYGSSTVPLDVLTDLKAKGGILVSPQAGTGSGGDCSGTGTFAMDDFKTADQIAACAVRDWNIDPHRIYSTGCSAGGLQAGCMSMMRSSYIAAADPNSGGEVFPIAADDPGHTPSLMTIHGAPGSDVVIVDFSQTSATMDDAIKKAGGFAVDCNHGGGHCGLPLLPGEVATAGWQFLQAHPFGVSPEPYTGGLPSSFPSYCKIW